MYRVASRLPSRVLPDKATLRMPNAFPRQSSPSAPPSARRGDILCVLALLGLWVLVHAALFRHLGMWVNDTGKEFGVPRDLLGGALLYRDTFWPYGPFPPYLNAGLLALFGPHTDVLLVAARLLGLAVCLAVYRTTRRFAAPPLALAAGVVVLGLGTTSGCFAVPYSFATLWSCLLGLLAADCLAAVLQGADRRRLLAVGVCGALLLLSKFTVAVFLAPSAVWAALLVWRRRRGWQEAAVLAVWLLAPLVLLALPVYLFFALRVRWDSFALQALGGFHSFNIRHGLLYPYLWRTMRFGGGENAGALLLWGTLATVLAGPACLLLARRRFDRAAVCYMLFAALNATQTNCTAHVPYILPAALVGGLWGLASLGRAGESRAVAAFGLAAGLAVLAGRFSVLAGRTVRVETPSASLRFAEVPGEALSRTVALVRRESPDGEPLGIFTGHDFLYQILDRPNRLGYYYTLFEPFRRPWAEERFLRRFREADFRLLITTTRESFSYAYILEIPETARRICGQLFAGYEPISGPECLPYTVWRRREQGFRD